ncbi:ankyrin repeat domain-containing protein 50 [Microdochium nivale]|nr:ankyrin repeat domain-containing protein 50 [Microdochium nivale]
MASPLESLPNEVLDLIIANLIGHNVGSLRPSSHVKHDSLAKLSQCSRLLNLRLEYVLYCTTEARSRALRYGSSRGNVDAIRKVFLPSSHTVATQRPDAISRPSEDLDGIEAEMEHDTVSALQLALKASHFEAFCLLLEFGVSVTLQNPHHGDHVTSMKEHVKTFAKRLAEPRNVHFLEAFIDARASTRICHDGSADGHECCSETEAVLVQLPLPDVVLWASPTLLNKLLDNGALLNGTIISNKAPQGPELPINPLGASILRGDMEIFELLVRRGAHLDMSDDAMRSKFPRECTHIPVFLAAWHMGITGRTEMLDACVKVGGADINRPCHMRRWVPLVGEITEQEAPHICTTPLLVYLNAVSNWDVRSEPPPSPPHGGRQKQRRLTPSEGVSHFLDALGAIAASPVTPPVRYHWYMLRNRSMMTHYRTYGMAVPFPIEGLLDRWGVDALARPEFFATVRVLVEHGGAADPDGLVRLLARVDGRNKTYENKNTTNPSASVDKEALWDNFLQLLAPHLSAMSQTNKNALLRRVIIDKGGLRRRPIAYPPRHARVENLGRASIRALVSVGANINAHGRPDSGDSPPTTHTAHRDAADRRVCPATTPLHQVILDLVRTTEFARSYLHDHPPGHDCPYTMGAAAAFGDYLAFLVSLGADPELEAKPVIPQSSRDEPEYSWYVSTWARILQGEEKSALGALLVQTRGGRSQHSGGTLEQGVGRMISAMLQSRISDSDGCDGVVAAPAERWDRYRSYHTRCPQGPCAAEEDWS